MYQYVLPSVLLQVLSHDPVPNIREKMLGCVFDLLYRKPEQEQELLSQLINKLGDPAKRVASKAILFLQKLCQSEVNCKTLTIIFHCSAAAHEHERCDCQGIGTLSA